MKYPIQKNTVQETLVIPLYGRKMCSEKYPGLFRDENALRLMEQIDYDFSELEKNSRSVMHQFGFLEAAMRQNDLAWEVRDYLKTHPNAAVVNLGCGLDATGRACDNGSCRLYNLDFPDVIAVRNQLLPAGEREENIACDLNDLSWFDRIDAAGGAVFFAAGVFYYFLNEQVRALFTAMADAFPGGRLVFDAAGKKAVRLMLKTWIKSANIQDVGAYFSVSDAKAELSRWSARLAVSYFITARFFVNIFVFGTQDFGKGKSGSRNPGTAGRIGLNSRMLTLLFGDPAGRSAFSSCRRPSGLKSGRNR